MRVLGEKDWFLYVSWDWLGLKLVGSPVVFHYAFE